ncbi:hypothetical protein HDZ31DRAFT_68260 [Schizophyllum fasciatum]
MNIGEALMLVRLQSNMMHLETRVRVLVEFADVRIVILGCLNKPRSGLTVNVNAHDLLHPPGIDSSEPLLLPSVPSDYATLTHPLPSPSFANYPFHTPSGRDRRWQSTGGVEEDGLLWVGPLMILAQLKCPYFEEDDGELEDLDIVVAPGRAQYTSFTWEDLSAVAPWMDERITKKIDGAGLGH